MKDSPLYVFAVKVIVCSLFGLSLLPFLAAIVQYLDSVANITNGNGYVSDYHYYIFQGPVSYILWILLMNIILASLYVIRARKSAH